MQSRIQKGQLLLPGAMSHSGHKLAAVTPTPQGPEGKEEGKCMPADAPAQKPPGAGMGEA